jgi:hypothetical protein
MASWHLSLAPLALAASLASGCDNTLHPNRPLAPFAAEGLDGATWDAEKLRGRPWVVNVWMPG